MSLLCKTETQNAKCKSNPNPDPNPDPDPRSVLEKSEPGPLDVLYQHQLEASTVDIDSLKALVGVRVRVRDQAQRPAGKGGE